MLIVFHCCRCELPTSKAWVFKSNQPPLQTPSKSHVSLSGGTKFRYIFTGITGGMKQVWVVRQQIISSLHYGKLEVAKNPCSTWCFLSVPWIVNYQSHKWMREFWTFTQTVFSLRWLVKLLAPVKNIYLKSTFAGQKEFLKL